MSSRLDPAKKDLVDWFKAHQGSIFYGRQIEVIFEKKYFHWITHKALRELTQEGAIASELRVTEKATQSVFIGQAKSVPDTSCAAPFRASR